MKLGCVMPGETAAVFGDALRRLAQKATYLYQDGTRYWYDTQPTVTKLADDRAEQLKRNPDKVSHEIDRRLRHDLAQRGDFNRIHPLPVSGADVPDDTEARLVVLGIDYPYCKESNCPAEQAAKAILETRGNAPRLFRNTLVFLAPDKQRLQDLEEGLRKFLAWESILAEKDTLDLRPHQVKQAEAQLKAADGTVNARLPETYQWLLVPVQMTPQAPVTWETLRLTGQDALAVRASKKLRSEELLLTSFAPTRLRMELDRVPLWRGDHVSVKQVAEDFARYLYLPRLKDSAVLLGAIADGTALLTWEQDAFAFADSFDEDAGRYRGLRSVRRVSLVDADATGLLVKPEVASKQIASERPEPGVPVSPWPPTTENGGIPTEPSEVTPNSPSFQTQQPKRFHGTVTLDATRLGRDAGQIAEEVVAHLVGLVGAKVKVTLEIEAEIPNGTPDEVVRVVTENSKTLKFTSQGLEKE